MFAAAVVVLGEAAAALRGVGRGSRCSTASFRFVVEFVRVPDAHLGYLAFDWLTMGQVLSLPLVAVGLFLLALSARQPRPVA